MGEAVSSADRVGTAEIQTLNQKIAKMQAEIDSLKQNMAQVAKFINKLK